jgi:hypothetical protein
MGNTSSQNLLAKIKTKEALEDLIVHELLVRWNFEDERNDDMIQMAEAFTNSNYLNIRQKNITI